jgi:hypothetical protein
MNLFAWNVALTWDKAIDLDFNYLETSSKTWDKVIFVYWNTEFWTSKEIVDLLNQKLWNLSSFDISISTEDKISILGNIDKWWTYELLTIEWENVNFDEIKERYKNLVSVICVREAEISKRFWNKVIKIDFVY